MALIRKSMTSVWSLGALSAACCLVAAPVLAEGTSQRGPGFYVGGTAGLQNRNRSAENDVIWTDWEGGGTTYSLHGGYRFNERFRADVEWARFKNNADMLSGGVTPDGFQLVSDASGDAVLNSVFINGNIDFEIQPQWTLSLGLGFGRMKSDVNNLTNDLISGAGFIFDGSSEDWINVWQFKVGVGYAMTDNFEVFGQYRHVDAGKFDFEFQLPNGLLFPAGPKSTKIDSGEIGVRYNF